jgi:hypothetical protein
VVALPDGAFVIVDIPNDRWLRVDARGQMTRLVGSRQLQENAHQVAAAPDGSLVVGTQENGVVRLAPDGRLTTLIGDGGIAPGGPISVWGLAVRADGGVLIADQRGNRVRLLQDGVIATVAGTGAEGQPSGDGAPAVTAVVPEPLTVSALADGAFLIGQGFDHSLIRRVGTDGRINTVAGGGNVQTASGCVEAGTPARALQLDDPQMVALPDASFLIVLPNAIYRVAADGRTTPITCTPVNASVTGRDVYWDGASARRADLGQLGPLAGAAVTSDGGLLIATRRHVALVPPEGGGQRLAAALPASNLARVPAGRVVVDLTQPANVALSVRRRGRTVVAMRTTVAAGRSDLRLPHKLSAGEYRVDLVARTMDGRVAVDRLAVLGRHLLDLGVVRRALEGYPVGEDALGGARCHRQTRLRSSCRVNEYDVGGVVDRFVIGVRLRRDGLLEARARALDARPFVLEFD